MGSSWTVRRVGAVRLAEVYYRRRYWGPRTVIVGPGYIRNVDIRRYVNVNKTVIIDREKLYSARGRYEPVKDARLAKEVANSGRPTVDVTGDAARGVDMSKAYLIARSGDFSRRPQFADAKPFERQQARVGGDNVKALSDGIRTATLNTPGSRKNQPLPFVEKKDQSESRKLPANPVTQTGGRPLVNTGIGSATQTARRPPVNTGVGSATQTGGRPPFNTGAPTAKGGTTKHPHRQ